MLEFLFQRRALVGDGGTVVAAAAAEVASVVVCEECGGIRTWYFC